MNSLAWAYSFYLGGFAGGPPPPTYVARPGAGQPLELVPIPLPLPAQPGLSALRGLRRAFDEKRRTRHLILAIKALAEKAART